MLAVVPGRLKQLGPGLEPDPAEPVPVLRPVIDQERRLGQDEEVVLKALRTNTAFFQREVANRVRTRYAAKIKFRADESFDEGGKIDALLRAPKVAQDIGKE